MFVLLFAIFIAFGVGSAVAATCAGEGPEWCVGFFRGFAIVAAVFLAINLIF